jgi:hypothetical protein
MEQAPPRRNVLPHWLSSYARDVVTFEKKVTFFGARYLSFAKAPTFLLRFACKRFDRQKKNSCCILLMEKKLGGQSV